LGTFAPADEGGTLFDWSQREDNLPGAATSGGVLQHRRMEVPRHRGAQPGSSSMEARKVTTHITMTNRSRQGTAPTVQRPRTVGYWVGGLIAIIAVLAAVVWGTSLFLGWRAHVEDFPRLVQPGATVVSVSDTGTRFIYLEHDRSTAVPAVPAISVTGPSGAPIRLTAYRGEMRYDVPQVANKIGDAVLTFPAAEPGRYRVTVSAATQGATVAVGDDLLWGFGPQVVGVVALLFGGLLGGLAVVTVTAARRSAPSV
jgi:hypothetical protein